MESLNKNRGRRIGVAIVAFVMGLAMLNTNELTAQSNGEALFKQNCSSCHAASNKRSTGPGLAGVTRRRKMDWILQWVANPSTMITAGDSQAVAIFKEYKNFPMPPQNISADDVKSIMTYLEENELKLAEKAKTDSLKKIELAKSTANHTPAKPVFMSKEIKLAMLIVGCIGLCFFFFMNYVNKNMVESVGHGLPYFDNSEGGFMDKWIAQNKPFVIFLAVFAILFFMRFIWAFLNHL